MEKDEHAARLRAAMAARGYERRDVADLVGVGVRTITNWSTGKTMPDDADRAALRKTFPGYDDAGDAVEIAVLGSQLTDDRQHFVIATYKRLLREQSTENVVAG